VTLEVNDEPDAAVALDAAHGADVTPDFLPDVGEVMSAFYSDDAVQRPATARAPPPTSRRPEPRCV
jgi:hypothetical protein